MIYVTGDTHCPVDIHKLNTKNFPQQKELTKNDYLIVCGDFGCVWYQKDSKCYKEDLYWQKWFREKPFTTLFVDGNHENHKMLNELPKVEMFGSKVGKVCDSVYHLKRGEVYTIGDKKFYCFGGASSHDKEHRIENVSWWSEEMPTLNEMNYGLDNLQKHNNEIDFVISHCCGTGIQMRIRSWYEQDSLTQYFHFIEQDIKYKHWYFGHYHEDLNIDEKHTCLYDSIIKIV